MSYKRVVVLGGGPIGLLCAIEAKQQGFREVYLIEKRPEYTRLNVPLLYTGAREHLESLVPGKIPFNKAYAGGVGFKQIEPPLLDKAIDLGVRVYRPYVVTVVRGSGEVRAGRVKQMTLTVARWDKAKGVDISTTESVKANLLIVASGAGTAEDKSLMDTLGFAHERLKPVNYMAMGVFNEGKQPDDDPLSDQFEIARKRISDQGGICFPTGDYQYMLFGLSGITKNDFELLKKDQILLLDLVTTLKRTHPKTTGEREKLKEIKGNLLAFEINIKRARQMVSEKYPALLVGDAAVTPHPDTGKGVDSGFRGFQEVKTLLEKLKTGGLENEADLYMDFNKQYEMHVCAKALEGTALICKHNVGLLETFRENSAALERQAESSWMRDVFSAEQRACDAIIGALKVGKNLAKSYAEAGKPWNVGPGRLWKTLDNIWGLMERLIQQKTLLEPQLAVLQKKVAFEPLKRPAGSENSNTTST
jgi:2-polyprenyl-6-methoxyphenol hydroxylase-like FAD-dependent oxidoreductase